MFELYKHFQFEAGHQLPNHKGKCRRPHGHSYKLTIKLRSSSLHSNGSNQNMVMDFADLSAIVEHMIDTYLDHHWLNDTLNCEAPTAEIIAQWIYRHLKPQLPQLIEVNLNETASAGVRYWEPETRVATQTLPRTYCSGSDASVGVEDKGLPLAKTHTLADGPLQ